MDGWTKLAGIIIRKKFWFLAAIVLITVFFGFQLFKLKLSYEQQAILPENHPSMQNYREFNRIFPKDNNIILIGAQDSSLRRAPVLTAWIDLARRLDSMPEVVKVISVGNMPELKLDRKEKKYVVESHFPSTPLTQEQADRLWKKWLDSLPFYHNRLINPETGALLTLVYVKKDLVDSKDRTAFITGKLIPVIEDFEKQTGVRAPTSGMLYIRTLNGIILKNEIPLYIGLTLLVTGLILWFLFRSFPPIVIAFTVVSLAVIWAMGLMGWLGFKITILTAIIPALLIVIGIPNTIFLINKYQQDHRPRQPGPFPATGHQQNRQRHSDDQPDHHVRFYHLCRCPQRYVARVRPGGFLRDSFALYLVHPADSHYLQFPACAAREAFATFGQEMAQPVYRLAGANGSL